MTLNEMKKAIKLGAKLGVARLKMGEFEVEYFSSQAQTQKISRSKAKSVSPNPLVADPVTPQGRLPSDDDFLFMASPFGPTVNDAGMIVEAEDEQT